MKPDQCAAHHTCIDSPLSRHRRLTPCPTPIPGRALASPTPPGHARAYFDSASRRTGLNPGEHTRERRVLHPPSRRKWVMPTGLTLRVVGPYRARDDEDLEGAAAPDAQLRPRRDRRGPDVERVCAAILGGGAAPGDPRLLAGHKRRDAVDEALLVQLRHGEALHAPPQASRVHGWAEEDDSTLARAVCLEALKTFHSILQATCDRVDLELVIRRDGWRVPALLGRPVDLHGESWPHGSFNPDDQLSGLQTSRM